MLTEKHFHTSQMKVNYAEGDTVGTPMVLLHGSTLHWQNYQSILPELEKNWHIYACDLRGHGKSGRVASAYRAVDFIPDTAEFIRRVISKPVILLGHSNGGSISLGVASQIPELIQAVVLLDPSLCLRNARLRTIAPYQWVAAVRDILASVRSAETVLREFDPGIDETGLQSITEMIQNVDPVSVTVLLNDQFFDGFDLEQVLQKIVCPTLLLYGEIERGSIVRQSDVEFLQTHVKITKAIQVKEASHSIHWDQPMQVMQHITEFLDVE